MTLYMWPIPTTAPSGEGSSAVYLASKMIMHKIVLFPKTCGIGPDHTSSYRVYNLAEGSLTTLELSSVPQPNISPDAPPQAMAEGSTEEPLVSGATVVTAEAPIRSATSRLRLSLQLPLGYHLTKGAKSKFEAAAYGPNAAGVCLSSFNLVCRVNPCIAKVAAC